MINLLVSLEVNKKLPVVEIELVLVYTTQGNQGEHGAATSLSMIKPAVGWNQTPPPP